MVFVVHTIMKKPLGSVTDSEYDAQPDSCEICGAVGGLDRHHVVPRRMGGTKDPDVHDESNLMTLCRACHSNIHEARWELIRSAEGFQVVDSKIGEQIMRRFHNPGVDVPTLFQILNLAEESLSQLQDTLPYLTDDQLTEAFVYARSFGKRSWLAQAAILYEAQRRGTYGERTMEAVARGFEIGLRQAQKYALVWKTFFLQHEEEENVNIDAILLDEPSWYVVAVTETKEPEKSRLDFDRPRSTLSFGKPSSSNMRRKKTSILTQSCWTNPAGMLSP